MAKLCAGEKRGFMPLFSYHPMDGVLADLKITVLSAANSCLKSG
jgi:hypothetical protein